MELTMVMVMTADGIVARGDEPVTSWTSAEDQQHLHQMLQNCDAMITGRKSFWSPGEHYDSYVLTHQESLLQQKSDARVFYVNDRPEVLMKRLEQQEYKRVLLLGGPITNYAFLAGKFVDDIYLTIEGRMFGQGKTLNIPEALDLRLYLDTVKKLNEQGTLLLHYLVEK